MSLPSFSETFWRKLSAFLSFFHLSMASLLFLSFTRFRESLREPSSDSSTCATVFSPSSISEPTSCTQERDTSEICIRPSLSSYFSSSAYAELSCISVIFTTTKSPSSGLSLYHFMEKRM